MLPPFIIEQIRQREEQERARPQPHLELPLDRPAPRSPQVQEEPSERGVIIIDLMNDS
jgi:hypothetical protein